MSASETLYMKLFIFLRRMIAASSMCFCCVLQDVLIYLTLIPIGREKPSLSFGEIILHFSGLVYDILLWGVHFNEEELRKKGVYNSTFTSIEKIECFLEKEIAFPFRYFRVGYHLGQFHAKESRMKIHEIYLQISLTFNTQ